MLSDPDDLAALIMRSIPPVASMLAPAHSTTTLPAESSCQVTSIVLYKSGREWRREKERGVAVREGIKGEESVMTMCGRQCGARKCGPLRRGDRGGGGRRDELLVGGGAAGLQSGIDFRIHISNTVTVP
jgi:hypothetical protein